MSSRIIVLVLIIMQYQCMSQSDPKALQQSSGESDFVSFVTKVDFSNVTKDGIYMKGYVVNIPYSQAKELDGKKVRISGEVTICLGLENLPKEYDNNGNEIIIQGREKDSKHLLKPQVEILQ